MNADEYLANVRALVPALRERARACEALRRVPDETLKDFHAHGLLRALQPLRWGGFELDPWTFYEAVMEVAAVCGSSGWVLGVLGVHNWQLALFPEQAQADVWRDDGSVQISSSYAPTGKVERVPGGFRVSGRWSFSSGCDHCEWVFLGGIAPGDAPFPDMRTYLLPRRDYRIDDNWHVSGLCGTGSKDIVVDGAFVPEHRSHRFSDAFVLNSPGQAVNPGPMFRLPFGCVFSCAIAAPAIGAARGALEHFSQAARSRVSALGGARVSDDAFVQARFADAALAIDAARESLRRDWRELVGFAQAGAAIPMAARIRCRFDATQAVARGVHAVDRLFEASGGRAIFLDNPIQRAFRDVHAMRAHAFNNPDKGARLFGRFELSPDTAPTDGAEIFV
ncbi:MAG TPA: acyl-CoA dehydrogenase family protein [Myxococcota bacterium]|nr:acyl-CoA dehydrogenase family protein [Myxococcota bacterium]